MTGPANRIQFFSLQVARNNVARPRPNKMEMNILPIGVLINTFICIFAVKYEYMLDSYLILRLDSVATLSQWQL